MTDAPPPENWTPTSSEQPPRWAWWTAGIAIPVAGILVSVLLTVGSEPSGSFTDNSQTAEEETGADPVEEPSPSTSTNPPLPSPEPSPSDDSGIDLTVPEGYTLHEGYWGITPGECTANEQRMVDLDTGITDTAIVSASDRGDPVEGFEGAELVYYEYSCSGSDNYRLKNLRGTTVGLLKPDMPHDFATCQMVSGTGLGPINTDDDEDEGFTEGAAICAVTDQDAVAMAMIDDINGSTVTGQLYVWVPDESP